MKKLITAILLVASTSALSEQAPENMYMKLDKSIGGYLTLTLEPCEISKVKDPYEFKAIIDSNMGSRRACWNTHEITPEMEGKVIPMVHVVEEDILEDNTRLYYIHTIARYYFKPSKE